jgi:hypothetical protein
MADQRRRAAKHQRRASHPMTEHDLAQGFRQTAELGYIVTESNAATFTPQEQRRYPERVGDYLDEAGVEWEPWDQEPGR